MNGIGPTILAIIGVSGDLAGRKLLPALTKIKAAGTLPEDFRVIGVSRRDIGPEDILAGHEGIAPHFETLRIDLSDGAQYAALKNRMEEIEKGWGKSAQKLYYLSIPPHAVLPVVEKLGQAGLGGNAKLLLEKPFGTDLASAQELIGGIAKYFPEESVYRIDHYLAKEMTQNIVVFRKENSLFRRTWNRNFIERIRIIALEKIGIEGRAAFYEQTGALRDVVQSHLLQVAALMVMQIPTGDDWSLIPEARAKALTRLSIKATSEGFAARRGQYIGYREETKNPNSIVETFAELALVSSDPEWLDVPIEIAAGKALDRKATEAHIFYRQSDTSEANELIIRVGENEGVTVRLWAKRPGYDHATEAHELDFSYKSRYPELPEAYERVFVDAMRSDHSLFASGVEALEAWRILEPLRANWERSDGQDIAFYERGAALA
jgi:glucose-6-phosphate 1-dehydrogenase